MTEESKHTATQWSDERRHRVTGTYQAVESIKAHRARERSRMQRIAEGLTRTASSMPFLAAHVIWFVLWIGLNVTAARPFDPYPFGLLTMIVSLEAIFLAIFVLITQARESETAELREEVILQVLLRTEEEVTKSLQLMTGLYARMGHELAEDEELRRMIRPLDAKEIERRLLQDLREASSLRVARVASRVQRGATAER